MLCSLGVLKGWDECCCQNCPRVFWLEAHSQKVYLFFPWTGAGPLTLGRSSQRWDVGWGCGACLTCTRVLSPASSWFTATPHSYLSPFILFYFYKNPLLPRGLYDEVNLSCAYLEPVSRRKKCQLLVFKNRLREHAFFLCCFFFPPSLLIAWWYSQMRGKSKHHQWLGIQGLFLFG